MKRIKKILLWFLITLIALVIIFLIYFKFAVEINPPVPDDLKVLKSERIKLDDNFYSCGNNWLRKSKTGLWELYLEGKPFERGVINGKLTKDLIYYQEKAFTDEFTKLIPSKFYLKFLNYFIAWFNRNLDKYVDKEYLLEIYGVSQSASHEFLAIGPDYQRMLNYHAAHDIGHALQNYHMVGCTSFSAWGNATEDSSLIVGRNFDFYVGDEFAKNKIVCFYNPDKGYKFMFIAWGGMIGVVSGMNEKGLTVTLNAAKSDIPFSAATPISIVAREILQYARNINEAYAIAKKRKTFVSESIMIGSAEDGKTAIIEKSPTKIDLFYSKDNHIICTNHFQSNTFINDKLNIENIKNSSSQYRFNRVDELLSGYKKLNVTDVAQILRDQKGLKDKNIGMGNEKSVNQLIAHHSIIFKPKQLMVWVSDNPYQIGEYIAYDLKKIFKEFPGMKKNQEIYEEKLIIPSDTFLLSKGYKDYKEYLICRDSIRIYIHSKIKNKLNEAVINRFMSSNPECFLVYSLSADYFRKMKEYTKAVKLYNISLTKEITSVEDRNHIIDGLKECYLHSK